MWYLTASIEYYKTSQLVCFNAVIKFMITFDTRGGKGRDSPISMHNTDTSIPVYNIDNTLIDGWQHQCVSWYPKMNFRKLKPRRREAIRTYVCIPAGIAHLLITIGMFAVSFSCHTPGVIKNVSIQVSVSYVMLE